MEPVSGLDATVGTDFSHSYAQDASPVSPRTKKDGLNVRRAFYLTIGACFLGTLPGCGGGGGGGGGAPANSPAIAITDAATSETGTEAAELVFTVSLSEASTVEVTVDYRTETGSAGVDDFVSVSGTLVFAPGETSREIIVTVLDDNEEESPETFTLVLTNPRNGVFSGASSAVATIFDDESPPLVTILDAVVVDERYLEVREAEVTVSLSRPIDEDVEVDYATSDDTARQGTDYEAREGTLRIRAGETVTAVLVPILGDLLEESNETFIVTLSAARGADLNETTVAEVTIRDSGEVPGLEARPSSPTCRLLDRPQRQGGVRLTEPFGFVNRAIAMFQPPGDNSDWYGVEKDGRIFSFENSRGASRRTLFLDIRDRVLKTGDSGLLSLAFSPTWSSDRIAYVYYHTDGSPNTECRLSRFRSRDGGDTLDPRSEEILLRVEQFGEWHKGACIRFGRDGYLYISTGDASAARQAQDPDLLPGKMLRIDVSRGDPYAIPPDNPYANGGGRGEVYAIGLRNPWTWTFDRETGEIWLGDVGNSEWEEVNRIRKGGNYGWPVREGPACRRTADCTDNDDELYDAPEVFFSHDEGNAVMGGYVYRGSAIPSLYGTYLYADWGSGKVWALRRNPDGSPNPEVIFETGVTVFSFAEDQRGELYIVAKEKIFKIVPGDAGASAFPTKLSDVPCLDGNDPRLPLPGLIPYDVNIPFWSNSAVKDRFVSIPDGEFIQVDDAGEWEFPVGTVFVKHLRWDDLMVETRLLIRHGDGEWGGYSYEWNEAQTDADLRLDGKEATVDGKPWEFPSSSQCLRCHTEASGRVLGANARQLNRDFLYESTARTSNQLSTFNHIGLFEPPLDRSPGQTPTLPDLDDPDIDIATRARAYLDVNCSHCHRPENPIDVSMDLRIATSFVDTNTCNARSVDARADEDERLLVPGDTENSLILSRASVLGSRGMPPLGKTEVDPRGTAILEEWIATLSDCETP